MQNLLVVGAESVVGANIAASLAERYTVTTFSVIDRYDLPHCGALDPHTTPAQAVTACRPDWVVHCGPAARSSWDPRTPALINEQMVEETAAWAAAAAGAGSGFVMISSDAVFTGPWLFHDEDSPALCHSAHAMTVRAAEQHVLDVHRHALVMRTNAFGWSGSAGRTGWLESLLAEIESSRILEQDHVRHATPILATDLAEILERACLERISGLYHVGGAERVSPMKFAQRLADQFNLPWLSIRREGALCEAPAGFGAGECSLQTKKIRKALCVAMPLLSEGLARLEAQSRNGYLERLGSRPRPAVLRAA